MKGRGRWAGIVALAGCVGLSVLGDGGTRPATQAEKAFADRLGGVLVKALPPAPAGWRVAELSRPETPSWMPLSDRPHPMELAVRARWQDDKKLQESQGKMIQAMGSVKKDPADEARLQVIQKKQNDLAKALGQAAEKGDSAGVQRIQKEMEPLNKEMSDILTRQAKGFKDALQSAAVRDAEVAISMKANATYTYLSEPVSREPPVAGLATYRVEPKQREDDNPKEGTTYVALGTWRTASEGGALRLTSETAGAATASLKTLLVEVQADKARARAILEKLDWSSIKALM